MKKPRRTTRWIVATAVLAILVAAGLNLRTLLVAAGQWLDIGRRPQRADAVVLLNGGYNTRPFVAAALVHGGWAPTVILNTVALHPEQATGAVPPSHEIALKALQYGGVPSSNVVLLDSAAKTTFDEAQAVASYLDANPANHLLLVTEAPHTRRAEWIFHRVLANRHVDITSVSAPPEGFEMATWWRNEAGFLFVVSEYLKLVFYALRYSWLGGEIIAVVTAFVAARAWFRRWRKRHSIGTVIYTVRGSE